MIETTIQKLGRLRGHLYLRDEWVNLVREVMPNQVSRIELCREGEAVAGIAAVRRGRTLESHALMPYCGPWLSVEEEWYGGVAHDLAVKLLGECHHAKLDLHPGWIDVDPFERAGWKAEPRHTFISDLSGNVEGAPAAAVRRRARRAAAGGVEFDAAVAPEEFVEIWQSTCKRRAIGEFLNPESLTTLLRRIVENGMGEILGSRLPGGRLVAGNVILYDEQSAYFWLSGFDPGEPYHGASNQLCHLQMLRRAATRVECFDWLGANTPGVTEYKASFGPRRVGHHRILFSLNPARSTSGWRRLFVQGIGRLTNSQKGT